MTIDPLEYLVEKFDINLARKSPIEIPNIGRDSLGHIFRDLGYTVGAEIGVQTGRFSKVLCDTHGGLKLYGIDSWQGYSGYNEHRSQDKFDRFYQETLDRMDGHDFHPIRAYSMDALAWFGDGGLDFVYIDANHSLAYVIEDIHKWQKKVKIGGIISGHDYREDKRLKGSYHVLRAVNLYTYCYQIEPWFLLGTKAKTPGYIRDGSRSWLWIKRREIP